jgi:hypothetical protein
MRGDAGLGQRFAGELARTLKLHALGQFEGCGDSLSFPSRRRRARCEESPRHRNAGWEG